MISITEPSDGGVTPRPVRRNGRLLWIGLLFGLLWIGGIGSLVAALIGGIELVVRKQRGDDTSTLAWVVLAIGLTGSVLTVLLSMLLVASGSAVS